MPALGTCRKVYLCNQIKKNHYNSILTEPFQGNPGNIKGKALLQLIHIIAYWQGIDVVEEQLLALQLEGTQAVPYKNHRKTAGPNSARHISLRTSTMPPMVFEAQLHTQRITVPKAVL